MNTDYIKIIGDRLLCCIKEGGKIFFFGNGGFASISDHMATEFMGRYSSNRPPFPAISLCSNPSLITCIGNDFGFEKVFSRQIEGLSHPTDVAIGMTTSGKSKNILEAAYACQRTGCEPWIITQNVINPSLQALCENIIALPSEDTAEVQNLTLRLLHGVCAYVEKELLPYEHCSPFEKALDYAYNKNAETLILDRDGIVNHIIPNGYVLEQSSLKLTNDFLDYIGRLTKAFKKIFIVTNQKCVGKGMLSLDGLHSIHAHLLSEVEVAGGKIDDIFTATSHNLSSSEYKPGIELAKELSKKHPSVDFNKTVLIGDSYSDFLFSENIGSTFIYCSSL